MRSTPLAAVHTELMLSGQGASYFSVNEPDPEYA
jgi:hypothetical protein